MTEIASNAADERKTKINRIEPVGNPTGRSAKAPEKGTDEIPETELNGEMFCYKRKKNVHEQLKKNGNMR